MAAVQTKNKAAENVFKSATSAAEEVMSANVGSTEPCSSLPKTTSVARAANRHRSKNRPKHPTTCDFELLDDHVASQFLRGDVHKNGTRHLIFATDAQLEFLTNAKTWYVDATFKVIKQAFTQLFSIHAFVKKDGDWCRLHSLSSSCRVVVVKTTSAWSTWKRVFRALIAALPSRPRVQAVVSDFEVAVWSAAREVLPGVLQRGCAFHFSHAVWRNIQAVGLQCAYLQTSLLTSFKPCILRPTTRGSHSICSTWSASGSAPPPGRLLPGQSSVSRCGPTTTWRAGIVDWTVWTTRQVTARSTYTSWFSCCTQKLHLYSLTCVCCLKATQCGCSASPSRYCTVVSANTGTSTWPALAPLIVCCVRVRTFARTCRLRISVLLCTVVTISDVCNFYSPFEILVFIAMSRSVSLYLLSV